MAPKIRNRIAAARQTAGWSQQELAQRTGLSRPEISAIETGRVTPAVAAALALARALNTTVESLFTPANHDDASARNGAGGGDGGDGGGAPGWAIEPVRHAAGAGAGAAGVLRFWRAEVAGRRWLYPAETTAAGAVAHDGTLPFQHRPELAARAANADDADGADPTATLVIATCDPAAALLAECLRAATRGRLRTLLLVRSSAAALELLAAGRIHAAGLHMAPAAHPESNAEFARTHLGETSFRLLPVADWRMGVVVRENGRFRSAAAVARSRLSWVGREPGAGGRRCLDHLLGPAHRYRRLAQDHAGVIAAVRAGFADAGVCPQLPAEEARLSFLPVQEESYALCVRADDSDWRLKALAAVLHSRAYRALLNDLPGYRTRSR
ncbi:MAG: substrate-binding domain-containing protein [Planctomycetota bacterium]